VSAVQVEKMRQVKETVASSFGEVELPEKYWLRCADALARVQTIPGDICNLRKYQWLV